VTHTILVATEQQSDGNDVGMFTEKNHLKPNLSWWVFAHYVVGGTLIGIMKMNLTDLILERTK